MFDKWLKLPAHYYLRITALIILTVGICLHNTLMSIATIWLGANWLIEAKYPFYWKKFKQTPAIWFLMGFLVLSFISLAWSDDVSYGLRDIGKKMPFFVIPFVLGTSAPIEKKIVYFVMYIFIGVLLLTSGINYYRFHYYIQDGVDSREMSYFISHIRYAIVVVAGIAVSIYLIIQKKGPRLLWLISGAWLIFYAYSSQSLTAYVLLFGLMLFSFFYWIHSRNNRLLMLGGYTLFICGLIMMFVGFTKAFDSFKAPYEIVESELDLETVNGRKYFHNLESTMRENGELVWIYMQQEELEKEWNNRSVIPYDSLDRQGQPMFGTLMRYLTSKGERKDSIGVWSLTENEILKIEGGKTSIAMNSGWRTKLQEFYIQWDSYKNDGDINGQSILQRAEHLKIAWIILKSNWALGVGIGDIHSEFQMAYTANDSKLSDENRHRSHNQFLSAWISHGLLGLVLIIGLLFSPIKSAVCKGYIFWAFFLLLVLSMLFQDLLETQAGVCIFSFLYIIMAFEEPAVENNSESEKR